MKRPVQERIEGLRPVPGEPIGVNWSAGFEQEPYLDRADLVLEDSLAAIANTHPVDGDHSTFLNLVTPGELGDPAGYLLPALREQFGDAIRLEEIGQCGCGGYVIRVWRLR